MIGNDARPNAWPQAILVLRWFCDATVASAGDGVTGTIRFGLFGAAHLNLVGRLVADVHDRFPHARLALIGQNSLDTVGRVRRGHLEAGLVDDTELAVRPVAHDEIVAAAARRCGCPHRW